MRGGLIGAREINCKRDNGRRQAFSGSMLHVLLAVCVSN